VPIPLQTLSNNVKVYYWPVNPTLTEEDDPILRFIESHTSLIAIGAAIRIRGKAQQPYDHLVPFYQKARENFMANLSKIHAQPETAPYDAGVWLE
jgi:hypothetical protein